MCRQLESIEKLNAAADALSAACRTVCGSRPIWSLRQVYSAPLAEPLPADMLKLVRKVQ